MLGMAGLLGTSARLPAKEEEEIKKPEMATMRIIFRKDIIPSFLPLYPLNSFFPLHLKKTLQGVELSPPIKINQLLGFLKAISMNPNLQGVCQGANSS